MSNMKSSSRFPALKSLLLGSAFALTIGAIVAGDSLLFRSSPAFAETAPITTPVFSFADVVERVQPAVVSIRVKTTETADAGDNGMPGMPELSPDSPMYEFFKRFGMPGMPDGHQNRPRGMSQGSGFFITADGYAVTNNHVVENGSDIKVLMGDGTEYSARLIGTDPKTDLALVKVDNGPEFPFVAFSKTDSRVGDWVVAVGNPFGLGGTVTAGIISARGRDIGAGPYDDFIQIDAPINKGNSGGPAFDLSGNVIGVNTAIYSPSGGSVGIGFAIPARTAEAVIADLKDDGKVVRGWLGVKIQPLNEDLAASLGLAKAEGALVTDPQENSPALTAGIEAGDAITAVNGQKITDARDLAKRIAAYPPNTTVDVSIWRDGKAQDVKVTLGALPDDAQLAALEPAQGDKPAPLEQFGLTLAPAAASGAGDAGVVVTELDPEGRAAEKGIRQGDVILEVAGQSVTSPGDVVKAVRGAEESGMKAVLLRVKSGDDVRFVAITLGKA